MKRKNIIILLSVFLVLIAIAYLSSNIKADRCPGCNVLLISIDTLRADHVGAYGYERSTTPNLDSLASGAILFENAISQAPSTLPSHTSMLTSLYPSEHGAEIWSYLGGSKTTLAEILKSRSYSTAAFVSGSQLNKSYNLGQGFDTYDDSSMEKNAGNVTALSLDWLSEHYKEKFFLLVHLFDPHHPYSPPEGYNVFDTFNDTKSVVWNASSLSIEDSTGLLLGIRSGRVNITEKELEHLISLYDGEIRHADYNAGILLDRVGKLGIANRTIIIIVSDHGEEFKDHGGMLHSHTLYNELLRVPLIIKVPGMPAARIGGQARLIDIMPTVLDALGIAAENLRGVSLLKTTGSLDAYSERFGNATRLLAEISLSTGKEKIIYSIKRGSKRIFDLESDPKELVDIANSTGAIGLDKKLSDVFSSLEREQGKSVINKEQEERLRSLGYMV